MRIKLHNMKGSPRCLSHLAALLLLLPAVCGCQGEQAVNAQTDDTTMLRVGVLPTQECMRLYYARHMGVADSLGVRLVCFRSLADIDTALMSGRVDVALTDTARLAYLLTDSAALKKWKATSMRLDTLCAASDSLWLLVTDSSAVKGVGGLKDKLVGMLR